MTNIIFLIYAIVLVVFVGIHGPQYLMPVVLTAAVIAVIAVLKD